MLQQQQTAANAVIAGMNPHVGSQQQLPRIRMAGGLGLGAMKATIRTTAGSLIVSLYVRSVVMISE